MVFMGTGIIDDKLKSTKMYFLLQANGLILQPQLGVNGHPLIAIQVVEELGLKIVQGNVKFFH